MAKQRKNKPAVTAVVQLSGNDNRHLFEATLRELNDRAIKNDGLFVEFGVPRLHDGASPNERITRYRHIDQNRVCAKIKSLWLENGEIMGSIETTGPMAALVEAAIVRGNERDLRFGLRAMTKPNNSVEIITYDLVDYGN